MGLTLAEWQQEVKAETVGDTPSNVETYYCFSTLAERLAQVKP